MKTSSAAFVALLSARASDEIARAHPCAHPPLEFNENVGLLIEEAGRVPAIDTAPYSYNMDAMDNFGGDAIYFIDQKNGIIYSYDGSAVATLFNRGTDPIPAGLTLDWTYGGASQEYRVKAMTQGPGDEVIVVFTSSTLPEGWTEADAALPLAGSVQRYACRDDDRVLLPDLYRVGTVPACSDNGAGLTTFTGYDAFYRFEVVDGKLANPAPFFVSESNVAPGHLGSGIVTLEDDTILWSTGDCTPFGADGSYAPQLDSEHCGKILHIDPERTGEFSVAALGVRNSQQMRLFGGGEGGSSKSGKSYDKSCKTSKTAKTGKTSKSAKARNTGDALEEDVRGRRLAKSAKKRCKLYSGNLAFMDIGGVTAEEVNAVPLSRLLESRDIPNFGWGRSPLDGKAREGTFYVGPGRPFVLGTEPPCESDAPLGEDGFVQPWIQFGRTEADLFYAISSFALPPPGAGDLRLLWSEFNTGLIMGTVEAYAKGAPPSAAYKLRMYNADGDEMNNLNDLVQLVLPDPSFTLRGDPRLFHFPDGGVGVLIERTGVFYRVTEIPLP